MQAPGRAFSGEHPETLRMIDDRLAKVGHARRGSAE
jgi:hypothetical protein